MKVVIVGGAGRVGLPFGLVLADQGHQVMAFDRDEEKVGLVNAGEMPFMESGAQELLTKVLSTSGFAATADPSCLACPSLRRPVETGMLGSQHCRRFVARGPEHH